MKKLAFWSLLLLPLVGGCARAPHAPGVLHLAQESDASTLDPAKAYDTSSIQFVRVMYRGLVDYNRKAEIVPELAQSFQVSPDGKSYTFHLRTDAKFWSGKPVEAEDFRFALERVLSPVPLAAKDASDGQALYTMIVGAEDYTKDQDGPKTLAHVKGIECPDAHTLIFRLNSPDATFLNWLTLPFAYAVNPAHVRDLAKKGLSLSENPDGTGPFMLEEWVHDGWLHLKKNPHYFRPELPKAERIEAQFGQSANLQLMLFEQGSLDILPLSDAFPPDFLRLKSDPKWQPFLLHAPMMDVRYVTLNTELAPFTDKRVRQAVNYAVNRSRIAGFLTGRATLAKGALPPGMPAYNPNLFQYPCDPAKARALLKAAHYQDKPLTLWYSTAEPWYPKAAQSIQADLKAVGMSVEIKSLRYSELKSKAGRRKTAQMAMMGWIQDFPDPANFLDVLFNGNKIRPTASGNRAFYSNPKVNALLDKAGVEQNRATRLKMYQEAEKQIVDDAPWLFLHHTERFVARQPWVEGFQLHPMWSATYENVGVK